MVKHEQFVVTSSEGPWKRLALIVSAIMNPAYVAVPTFFLIALHTSPGGNIILALLWWGVTVVGFTIAPLLFVRRGVRLGQFSDHHVSQREQRLVPLLFGLGCCLFVFVLLFLTRAPRSLIATVLAALLACALATAITQVGRWKISLHLAGCAGAVTAFGLVFGPSSSSFFRW